MVLGQPREGGAIELSYSSIKDCAAYTTSKEFEVRWWHFGFACVIYNMWLLVDLLTQERSGVIETRKKSRITRSRFQGWLDKELFAPYNFRAAPANIERITAA